MTRNQKVTVAALGISSALATGAYLTTDSEAPYSPETEQQIVQAYDEGMSAGGNDYRVAAANMLAFADQHWPTTGAAVMTETYGNNLYLAAYMPQAPEFTHLAEVASITLDSIQMMSEVQNTNIVILESSLYLEAGLSVSRVTGDQPDVGDLFSIDFSEPDPRREVRMRVRARPRFRVVFDDGGASGTPYFGSWCEWSDWFNVTLTEESVTVLDSNGSSSTFEE